MAYFTTLYSGSSGNCGLVRCGDQYLLIDMGKSCRTTLTALKSLHIGGVDVHHHIHRARRSACLHAQTTIRSACQRHDRLRPRLSHQPSPSAHRETGRRRHNPTIGKGHHLALRKRPTIGKRHKSPHRPGNALRQSAAQSIRDRLHRNAVNRIGNRLAYAAQGVRQLHPVKGQPIKRAPQAATNPR